MKYKVGQHVKIKSLDWYNKNKDILGNIECGDALMTFKKSQLCGKIVTISHISDVTDTYEIEEDNGQHIWTDEMIEGLAEEPILSAPNITEGVYIHEKDMKLKTEYILPDGHIFKDENGNIINATKIVLERKKKEYPKTYEECLSVLGIYNGLPDVEIYNAKPSECKLFESFIRLKRCRDAYWKIAGEEMGLGKPWKPDYSEESYEQGSPIKYVIYYTGTHITKEQKCTPSYILAFPTAEMRDDFKENFDPDIEFSKELL